MYFIIYVFKEEENNDKNNIDKTEFLETQDSTTLENLNLAENFKTICIDNNYELIDMFKK